jgi:hypothetical protein
MERKSCSLCPRPADFSLAFLVSTIGVRPRGQKCTQTVPLCKSCLSDAAPCLASTPLQDLQDPLRDAYTGLGGDSPALPARRWPLPCGGRGPPGRRGRPELQAMSNSLQLT